jgi:hypothetical protein
LLPIERYRLRSGKTASCELNSIQLDRLCVIGGSGPRADGAPIRRTVHFAFQPSDLTGLSWLVRTTSTSSMQLVVLNAIIFLNALCSRIS